MTNASAAGGVSLSPGPRQVPILLYHVTWPDGLPHVLSSGFSSAAPRIGKSAGGVSGTSVAKDGVQLQVTRPAGTLGSASVGALLTGVTFPPGDYLLEATLSQAAGPTAPPNYLWAIALVLKDGTEADLPTDTGLSQTLHFSKNPAGIADSALVNMPGLQNQTPAPTDPTVTLAPADYARVTNASPPEIDFTMSLRLDFGGATGDATVAVDSLPAHGGRPTNYMRHGEISAASQAVAYTTAGVVVILARGDGMTASVILKDFKISQFN